MKKVKSKVNKKIGSGIPKYVVEVVSGYNKTYKYFLTLKEANTCLKVTPGKVAYLYKINFDFLGTYK